MNIFIGILTVLLILLSVFIVLVVLIQKPRADSGLGTAMGGGMAEATFGAETGNVLTRATIASSIAFFVLAFGLYLLQLNAHKKSLRADAGTGLPSVTAPASTAPAPVLPPVVGPETTPATSPAPAPTGEQPAAPKP